VGTFSVGVTLTGPAGVRETLPLLVDTGATFVVVPQPVAARLGLTPVRAVPVQLGGGQRVELPVAEVRVTVEGLSVTTPCFISPDGLALLGAVALESLLLAADPVGKRLVPTEGIVAAGAGLR